MVALDEWREPAARPAAGPEGACGDISAARALLDSGGLAAVTMDRVAALAGVGKPTIYRHWPNAHAVAMAAFLETATTPEPRHRSPQALRRSAGTAGRHRRRLRRFRTGSQRQGDDRCQRGRDRARQSLPQPLHRRQPRGGPRAAGARGRRRRAAPGPGSRGHARPRSTARSTTACWSATRRSTRRSPTRCSTRPYAVSARREARTRTAQAASRSSASAGSRT